MSIGLTGQQQLPKTSLSRLKRIQEVGGEEEMAPVEAQEAEVVEGMVKGMVVQKAQEEQATKREQAPLKIALEEVRRIITPTREMLNVNIVISMGIMQVNAGRSRVISQSRMLMWLM